MKPKNTRRTRGTILILVVAVLGLLVVMGTAYLVSSRTDSGAVRLMNDAVNLDFATRSVLTDVQNTIFESSLDPNGKVLGGAWVHGQTYSSGSFAVDPITGEVCKSTGAPATQPSSGGTAWTAAGSSELGAARLMDFPEPQTSGNWGNFEISPNVAGMRSQAWLVKNIEYTATDSVSVLRSHRFDPATGTYDTAAFSLSGVGPEARVVNSDTSLPEDGVWDMLPFSTSNGIRYRYALRIVDTNQMANLNVGNAITSLNAGDYSQGQSVTSLWLNCPTIFNSGTASNLNYLPTASSYGVRGRGQQIIDAGDSFPSTVAAWQNFVLAYEKAGLNPAVSNTNRYAEWFDLTDEIEFRSYDYRGNNYMARPAANTVNIWPNTLGAGNTRRRYYTTYSFDRNWSPVRSGFAPYEITAGFTSRWLKNETSLVDELLNRKLNLAMPIVQSSWSAIADENQAVARQFVHIANAMYMAGFTPEEAFSYAINYVAQTSSTTYSSDRHRSSISFNASGVGTLTFAPSSATYTVNCSIVAARVVSKTIYAYSAQPFINEVAIAKQDNSTGDTDPFTPVGNVAFHDFAVELMNPYQAQIPLNGWRIRVHIIGGPYNGHDYTAPLTGTAPARSSNNGIFLVQMNGGTGGLTIIGSPETETPTFSRTVSSVTTDMSTLSDLTHIKVFLERPNPQATDNFLTVDSMELNFPVADSNALAYSRQRPNRAGDATPTAKSGDPDWWACMYRLSDEASEAPVSAGSPGAINTIVLPNDATHHYFGVELRDRLYMTSVLRSIAILDPPGTLLSNGGHHIGDLVNFSRIAIVDDGVDRQGTTIRTMTDAVSDTAATDANQATSHFAQESRFFFDFTADGRAANLLNYVTTVDRASDGFDQTGNGIDTKDEVRIPGRVNVNTASFDVLCALLRGATITRGGTALTDSQIARYAVYIIMYRDRRNPNYASDYATNKEIKSPNSSSYSYTIPSTAPDFRAFSGTGIRSLAELAIPFGIIEGTIAFDSGGTPKYTVNAQPDAAANGWEPDAQQSLRNLFGRGYNRDARGSTWGRLFASATTRSDTFVVYGYVEAIKQNLTYSGTFNNGTDWYHGATAPRSPATSDRLQLVASRRFVAIMDRSFSNNDQEGSAAVLPKIVAYKELPR